MSISCYWVDRFLPLTPGIFGIDIFLPASLIELENLPQSDALGKSFPSSLTSSSKPSLSGCLIVNSGSRVVVSLSSLLMRSLSSITSNPSTLSGWASALPSSDFIS